MKCYRLPEEKDLKDTIFVEGIHFAVRVDKGGSKLYTKENGKWVEVINLPEKTITING